MMSAHHSASVRTESAYSEYATARVNPNVHRRRWVIPTHQRGPILANLCAPVLGSVDDEVGVCEGKG